MTRRHLIILVACLLTAKALSAIDLARAGTWPERVVRVLTPGAPGSSIDLAARVFAERLAERLALRMRGKAQRMRRTQGNRKNKSRFVPADNFRDNLGYMVKYSTRMHLAQMTPQPSLASTGWALAHAAGSQAEYLVYQPGSGGFTVNPEFLFAFHTGKLGLGIDAGFRLRSHHPANLPWGDELTVGPWVSYGLTKALTIRGEIYAEKEVNTRVAGADFHHTARL